MIVTIYINSAAGFRISPYFWKCEINTVMFINRNLGAKLHWGYTFTSTMELLYKNI